MSPVLADWRTTGEPPLPDDDLHPFVAGLFSTRRTPEPDTPKAATRIRELEKALAHAHLRTTMAEKRCDLAEARARELVRLAAWGGRRQG